MMKQTIRINQQTEVELIKTTNRTEIILTYEHEDPDVGQEIAVYGSNKETTFSELAHDWAEEVNDFIDGDKTYGRVYEDYSSNMWYEIVNAMDYLQNYSFSIKNKEGNLIQITTVHEAARMIRDAYVKCLDRSFNFKTGDIHGTTIDMIDSDEYQYDSYAHWYGVKKIEVGNLFDGGDGFIVATGCYGGGDVKVVYCDPTYEDDIEIADKIEETIYESSGEKPADLIVLEIMEEKV